MPNLASKMMELELEGVYRLASLTESYAFAESGFFHYDENFFINASTKFSKQTLLHHYIATTAINAHRLTLKKHGSEIDFDEVEALRSLMLSYNIDSKQFNLENEEAEGVNWLPDHDAQFEELFEILSEQVFYILFANRGFLLQFNELVARTVQDTAYPIELLTKKGTIRRKRIPEWLKRAIWHRDRGRCVLCLKDLAWTQNTLSRENYDHIVPLDSYGANDPTNIQLTCETCNKRKSNSEPTTSSYYEPWWPS